LNSESSTIRGRVDVKLYPAFKVILSKLNMTQQDFIDMKIKEFVLEYINLVLDDKSDKK